MDEAPRVAFSLFGYPVYWYGILIAAAVMAACALATRREARLRLQKGVALDSLLWVLPVGLVCARLYYVAFRFSWYAENPLRVLDLRQGGLAIYGGILGGLAALAVFSRRRGLPLLALCDLYAPSLALGQAIGRWGNFLNQEAYGPAVNDPRLTFFPLAVWVAREGRWHLATFFYESVWCLLLTTGLLLWERRHANAPRGAVFYRYLFFYGAERALVEGLRSDSLYWGPLRVSQVLSIVLLILAGILILRQKKGGDPPRG